jgi:hypothetical protein
LQTYHAGQYRQALAKELIDDGKVHYAAVTPVVEWMHWKDGGRPQSQQTSMSDQTHVLFVPGHVPNTTIDLHVAVAQR